MLKSILNISDREHRAFALGFASGSLFLSFLLIGTFNLPNITKSFFNKLNFIRRTKLLNGGKNVFYFETEHSKHIKL
jgi:hypothetical protein